MVTPCKGCVDWNIPSKIFETLSEMSHPAKGVWIEMPLASVGTPANSVTPCKGCVDWNRRDIMTKYEKYCHTLQRVCGLKYNTVFHLLTSRTRHTLQRVCGLKFKSSNEFSRKCVSHPAKGVWIEISGNVIGTWNKDVTPCKGCVDWNLWRESKYQAEKLSHPAKGVWIEINFNNFFVINQRRHTLQRVCGLKYFWTEILLSRMKSHPAKGVWIEIIPLPRTGKEWDGHTLQRVCGLK